MPPVHTGPMPVRALQAIHVLFLGSGFVWLRSDGYNMTFMWDPVFNSGIPVCSAHSPCPHSPSMVPSAAYFIYVIFIGGGLVWLCPDGRNVTFRSIPTLNSAVPLPFYNKDAPLAGPPLPLPRVHTVRRQHHARPPGTCSSLCASRSGVCRPRPAPARFCCADGRRSFQVCLPTARGASSRSPRMFLTRTYVAASTGPCLPCFSFAPGPLPVWR